MEPLISVVVPVYKVEQYLGRCVESLLSQTYKNTEIILVDDGSPDHCPKMCDEYAAKYPTIVKAIHKENGGLSSARNAGIDNARGEFIVFPDPDDWVEPDYVASFLEFRERYQADLVCLGHYVDTDTTSVPAMPDGADSYCDVDREQKYL